MKYFTNQLWEEINCGIKERREIAEKQWKKNVEEYAKLFEGINHRFSKKFLNVYSKEDNFHDYELKEICVSQGKAGYSDPVKVDMIIYNQVNMWRISYTGIEKTSLDYFRICPSPRHFQYGFDEYKYDEFYEINDKLLSHEILFGSGAILLIYFNKVSIKKITSIME